MKLKTGVDSTSRMSFKNTRGLPFHGMGAFVGTGKTQRAHVYTAASIPVDPEAYKKIDPKKLAVELGVDMCAVNSGRFWMMDELEFVVGEVQNFHGVELRWGGDMTGAEMVAQFQSAYTPSLIQRNTNWIFYAGKPVHLLREPNGAVWVLQEYTKAVDPSLTPDNLNTVGGKLKNSAARLEVRDQGAGQELVAGYGAAGGWAAIIRDDLALYLPGLRLRQRHQRQLCAISCRQTAELNDTGNIPSPRSVTTAAERRGSYTTSPRSSITVDRTTRAFGSVPRDRSQTAGT